jgi:chemosensory pili system protein ChpA (sensor histidine kinase/response regulator)
MSKILVVDDADDVRSLLARLLRLGGYTTATAEDGMAGLAQIEQGLPDLIVLDLMMPRMNGVEMLSRLRHDPRWRNVPVLIYTAVSSGKMIEDCERLGIQGRIVKGSVESTGILEFIGRVLQPPSTLSHDARWHLGGTQGLRH